MAKKTARKKTKSRAGMSNGAATKKKKSAKRKSSTKRELINTGRDKRYVRRDDQGQFDEVDDQGRSLSQDRRRKSKKAVISGQGDKGDRKPAKKKKAAKKR
jgi:hypothetical protein